MSTKISLILGCAAIASAFVFVLLQSNKYVPIAVLIPAMNHMRMSDCSKIELDYTDLTSVGNGKAKKLTITDPEEIQSMIDLFVPTVCWRSGYEKRTGASNVTISFFADPYVTIKTNPDGGIWVDDRYYATSTQLGTYLTRYVTEIQ